MSEANIWQPRTVLQTSSDTKIVSQRITATAGQTLFTITDFAYVLGTGALAVFRQGSDLNDLGTRKLAPVVGFIEQTTTSFSLVSPAVAGEKIIVEAHVGLTANVDVRDTDIYVANYQAIRDYVGTEITLYSQGQVTAADGGEDFFQKLTGAAVGFFVDDNELVIRPTGGDGTIGWVRKALMAKSPFKADNLAAAALLNFANFDLIETVSFYSGWAATVAGPKGGSEYHSDGTTGAVSTLYADNSGFFDAKGKGFKISIDREVTVFQLGARGDGATDDTDAFKDAVALDTTVYVPPVTTYYELSDNIAANDGQTIYGDGFKSKLKLISASTSGQLIGAIGTTGDANHVRDITIRALHLDTSDLVGENGVGFAFAENTLTTECFFSNIGRKAWTVQVECTSNIFTDSVIISAQTEVGATGGAISIEGETGDVNSWGNIVSTITIEKTGNTAVQLFNTSFNQISSITVEDAVTSRVLFITGEVGFDCVGNEIDGITVRQQSNIGIEINNAQDNTIKNAQFPSLTGQIIKFDTNAVRNKLIGGKGVTTTTPAIGLALASATDNTIEDFNMQSTSTDCWAPVGNGNKLINCKLASVRTVNITGDNCEVRDCELLPSSSHSVSILAGAVGTIVDNNSFGAAGSAGINNLGADTVVTRNTDLSGTPFAGSAVARRIEDGNSWNPREYWSSIEPVLGTHTAGDFIHNTGFTVDGNNMHIIGWRCTVSGTPGTFVTLFASTVSPAT